MSNTNNEISIDSSTVLDDVNSLIDLIEMNDDNSVDDNNEPILLQNSPYYNDANFINILKQHNNNFSILSLNCQSLFAKFDILKCYVENYLENNCFISAICLQETWLKDESDLSTLQINGYNLISRGKSCSAHGGVAFYLHNSFQFTIIDTNFETFDSVCIEVPLKSDSQFRSDKLVICNIYRPPRTLVNDIEYFMNELNILFDKFARYKHVVFTGDYNIDLLKYQENSHINNYFDLLLSNSYVPKITLPTRLTHRQGTLIDNFFVKISSNYSKTSSGIILNDISDHLPYFTILEYLNHKNKSDKHIKISNFSISSMQNFKADLQKPIISEQFRNILDNDPDASYDKFHNVISNLINTSIKSLNGLPQE
jgi:hypothetical protein